MSLCDRTIRRATRSFPSLPFGHQNAAQPTNCGGNAADGRQQPTELVDMAWRGRGQEGAPKNERIGRKRMGKLVSGRQALVVGAVCLAVLFLGRDWARWEPRCPARLSPSCGHGHGAPIRHEREHHRRSVHHQRRLARAARAAALDRFAARPASQRRRRRKKGRWLGATRLQKAVEHNDARPPKFTRRSTFALYV